MRRKLFKILLILFLKKNLIFIFSAYIFRDQEIEPVRYPFMPDGSDERQYSSPGFRIPVTTITKDKYYEYPEYHTDKDNFKVVTQKGLEGSFKVLKTIIDAFELGLYPKSTMFAEPNLGKRGLYHTLSQKEN